MTAEDADADAVSDDETETPGADAAEPAHDPDPDPGTRPTVPSRHTLDRTMRVHRRPSDGDEDRDLLFVLGWGNRPDHPAVDWLLDRLSRSWTVHAVALPENGTEFARDYRDPLAGVDDRVDPDARLGHSLGGLVLAHLPGDAPRLYASPFWGIAVGWLAARLLPAVARLPVARRLIPLDADRAVGEFTADDRDHAADRGVSPAWLGAVTRAQATLPPFREGSVVYCSLRDEVVDLSAVGEHAPADRVRLYDGTHEFFASRSREATVERVREDLRAMADGDR